jgi:hypothetical protein
MGPRAGLDNVEKRKILSLPRTEPRPSSSELSHLHFLWHKKPKLSYLNSGCTTTLPRNDMPCTPNLTKYTHFRKHHVLTLCNSRTVINPHPIRNPATTVLPLKPDTKVAVM